MATGIGKIQNEADLEAFVKSRLEPLGVLIRQLQGNVQIGSGSPEGVRDGAETVFYLRDDPPDDDNAVYFNAVGGTTGWRRLTSTGHAAA